MLSKITIQEVVKSQKERLLNLDTGLLRHISSFESLSSHALIVTGIRRCGKSTWLQQIYRSLNKPALFLNFEDPRLAGFDLEDFNRLHEIAIENKITTYLFDEIQNIPQWEKFVRFRLDEGFKVFITGSNASMLSNELGTKLTGRHISKEMYPFSYLEFLEFKKGKSGEKMLKKYLYNGGFPEFIKTGSPDVLMNLFNDIIIRDIAVRHSIKNTGLLLKLAGWLVSNIGKPFTANSLRKIVEIHSSSTMMEYLSYFVDSYLFFFVPKFSYSHKVQLVNPKKIYCIDNGLVVVNSLAFTDDNGRLLENMVFLHLRKHFSEIYYYFENKECDFVVFKKGKFEALYQVCWRLDHNNMTRETAGLIDAMNYFKVKVACIITLNQQDNFVIDGKKIEVIPFYKWVLQ